MMGWRVELDGVTLSGGDAPGVGCLTVPPDGMGLPGLRTEDQTFPQRDGVRHYADWYEPRIITLEGVSVCRDECRGCLTVREKVRQITNAWSRRCDDVELVIWPDCESPDWDADREVVGPFGVVGRPRVAEVVWSRSNIGCATLLLRFDAEDHKLFLLDRDGTPGSGGECITLTTESFSQSRCYPRCYTGDDGGGQETLTRTNLHPNPFLGSGGAGWTLGGRGGVTQTLETEGGPLIDGRTPPWRKLTFAEGSGDPVVYSNGDGSPRFPLTDDEVAVSAHVMGSGIEVELGLQTDVGEVWGSPFNPGEGWTRLDSVLTPPPGSTEGRLLIRLAGESITPSSATGVTGGMVGATGTTFDGDNPSEDGFRYNWTGTPYQSSSQEWERRSSMAAAAEGEEYCYDQQTGQEGDGPITFTVRGDTCVSPTITLYGPLTNPIIENVTTGEEIGYAGTIQENAAPVIIDTESGTATQGGESRTHLLYGDTRMLLNEGENTLRLTSFQSTDYGTAEVCWRPAVISA